MQTGNRIVFVLSLATVFSVCRYRSCKASGVADITRAASFSDLLARCSPSAAITLARASRTADASIAIARCNCTGRRTSFLLLDAMNIYKKKLREAKHCSYISMRSTRTPQGISKLLIKSFIN